MKGYIDGINFHRNNVGLISVPIIIIIIIIISEGGTDEKYMECSNYDLDIVDKMTLPFTGVAGINAWFAYTPNKLESKNDVLTMPVRSYDMWDNTTRVKNHMNGNDVINTLSEGWGGWSHGMEYAEYDGILRERYSVEHQYYTSSNKSKAVGYVRNRSFNVKTRGDYGTKCYYEDFNNVTTEAPRNTEWNEVYMSKRLRVNNLKTHTEYKIDWYSKNLYLKTDCIETNKKNGNWGITLEYPELTVSHTGSNDLPAVWYVVYQQPCNSGMTQQNNMSENEEEMNKTQLLNIQSENENILNVHPNAFSSYISIQSPEKDELILKSIEGKVIDNYKIDKGQTIISTLKLTNGIYILTFINQNKTFKLIKR